MKTPSPRARLSCRIARHWAAAESAHVAGCAACQEYFATSRTLESALRRDAVQLASEPGPGFERRLLHAVRRAEAAPACETSARGRGLWLAGAALAAIACGVVVLQRGPAGGDASQGIAAVTPQDAAIMVDAVQSLSNRFVDSVIPSAGAMVADNPLQRELDSLQTDARSALRFLALNFLPSAAATAQPKSG